MYDIKKLEEEWQAYNKKRNKPKLIILVSLLFLIFGFYLFVDGDYNVKLQKLVTNVSEKVNNSSNTTTVSNSNVNEKVNTTSTKLENEIKVIKKIDHIPPSKPVVVEKIAPIASNLENKINNKEATSLNETQGSPFAVAQIEPVLEEVESLGTMIDKPKETLIRETPSKKIQVNIIEISDIVAYKDVENRFYKTKDIDDSLFLARSYFKKEDYKKAEFWAQQTNDVDNKIEESWLILVESKFKLGHKNEAIRVLKSYINKSGSTQAKRLLNKLK